MSTTTTRKATVPCAACGRLNRVDLSRAKDGPKCGSCGRAIPLDHPLPVTDQTMERVVRDAEVPVLVDFYADWCGPCKMMAPFVDELAAKSSGRALIAKLDTDHAQRVAAQFNIRGIPTTIVFRDGAELARQTGAMPLRALEALLDRAGPSGVGA